MVPNLNFENEASKLKSDINNYLNEINAKIINILNERYEFKEINSLKFSF